MSRKREDNIMNLENKLSEVQCLQPLQQMVLMQEETTELVMPDYCADVGRIISCHAEPMICDERVFDSGFEISGNVCVTVLYIAENISGLRSHKLSLPFHIRQEAAGENTLSAVDAKLFLESCDCRLLNARKLFCHCKIKAVLQPYAKSCVSYCDEIGAEDRFGVQCMKKTKRFTYVQQMLDKSFHFSDSIAVSSDKQGVEEILLTKITPLVSESKLCGTKLIVKGGFEVSVLCRSEGNQYFNVSENLPFSQIIEAENLSADTVFDTEMCLCEAETSLSGAGNDETSINLLLSGKLTAKARATKEISYLSDLYSIRYPTAVETAAMEFSEMTTNMKKQQELRQLLETGVQATDILLTDISCSGISAVKEGDGVSLRTLLTIQVLYLDESETPALAQTRAESSVGIEGLAGSTCHCESCNIKDTRANIMSNGIEVCCGVEFPMHIDNVTRDICIRKVQLDEEHPKDLRDQPSVVVRRCGEGDSLWDLARTHNTTMEAIEKANPDAGKESLRNKLLLIPRVKA